MKIYFASDHAGFKLKEALIPFVQALGFEVRDFGAFVYDENDDYPDYIKKAAAEVSHHSQHSLGIIIGGSGEGEAIVANKFPHVRATVYYGHEDQIIRLSREHNDANILSLGARFMDEAHAKKTVREWLMMQYSVADRHKRRIQKIKEIERKRALGRVFLSLGLMLLVLCLVFAAWYALAIMS